MSNPTIKLNDNTEVPSIAYGCGTALFNKDCTSSIKQAIDCGFFHLDGAQAYGNEQFLGAGIKAAGKARSELYIVTKLKSGVGSGTAQVKASLVESLQKLGAVDLYLIHSPRPLAENGTLPELWAAMEAVHAEGLAKSIGAILQGAKIPCVNQIEIHPLDAGGPVDEVLLPIVERLSKAFGKPVTAAQVLGKWVSQKGAFTVTGVVEGTSSKEDRLKEYLETFKIEAIDAAGAKLHKRIFMKHVFGE
ncbi:NADP-dependent oxidoreductase domain-containing protein [Mycena rosella]|uniref:NADP-dependent oxidoreductase domain-containing protein n=1 Tax=Mycena rosella TaxID=1033263 RepID=A0AAD7MBU0_MYCRO|nr:NADP-dependent oxidoreductase domain-containing protein [Mycena rosella]